MKAENFRNSQNKSAYLYHLSPSGVTEKTQVTRRFLQWKLEKHQQIEQKINSLKEGVARQPQR